MERILGFDLIMISAMYETGGNVTHRLLDGHPELYVYPFESQLGNSLVADYLSSMFPFKYRWPEFTLSGTYEDDYELFYDEEMKVRIRTPHSSKFRDADIKLDESERKKTFANMLENQPRTRAHIIAAFFRATFDSWANLNKSGKERIYVGYSPIIVVDTEKILADFPSAHIIHVVRNPFSAYADTKRRPFPLSIRRYTMTWNLVQHIALTYAHRFPNNVHILRYEDIISDPRLHLSSLLRKLNLSFSNSLLYPSWNGKRLDAVYPWGTIRELTPEANMKAVDELSASERAEIRSLSTIMLEALEYQPS